MQSIAALLASALCGLPCDEYAAGGTPCVAAHSTVRALFASYAGPLYTVTRGDGRSVDVTLLRRGGVANVTVQELFCRTSQCTITGIYDQSPNGNHLGLGPGGEAVPKPDKGTVANRSRTSLSGIAVYAAYFEGGMGFRNDTTTGVATGDEPESIYMVTSGRHYNDRCCFDYGNAETNNRDDGKRTMEAIYFGNASRWGHGSGSGPWVLADLENGLWGGNHHVEHSNTPIDADYVTAMLKGRHDEFALKNGNAQRGPLKKLYEGKRPWFYHTMKKQGAIILGVGGDNSNWAVGTFYEGALTRGYATDATDDAVQASIVAAGYGR